MDGLASHPCPRARYRQVDVDPVQHVSGLSGEALFTELLREIVRKALDKSPGYAYDMAPQEAAKSLFRPIFDTYPALRLDLVAAAG